MLSFAEVNELHRLYHRRSLTYHSVHDEELKAYCRATKDLLKALRDTDLDAAWSDFVHAARRFRFDALAALLAFNADAIAPRVSDAELKRIRYVVGTQRPSVASLTYAVIDGMFALRARKDAPLREALFRLDGSEWSTTQGIAVLVASSRFVAPTKTAVSVFVNPHIDVVTASSLRGRTTYERLFVIGPTRWYPDYVFDAPRAQRITVVSYAWNQDRWRPPSFFLGTETTPQVSSDGELIVEASEMDLDTEAIEQRMGARHKGDANAFEPDLIPARLYLLDGDNAVFLDASGRRATLAIDLEAEERSRVRQVADNDIEPGMFVMLRTDSGYDYIASVADRLLGARAPKYRECERMWKALLREQVRRLGGLTETSIKLLDLESARANEPNLAYWMSDRNIAPSDYGDFAAIMRLICIDGARSKQLWEIACTIRKTHMRAGALIRRALVAKVRETPWSDFERRGRIDFELPEVEGGRLTAFRVEKRASSTVLLPGTRLEHVFPQGT